MTRNCKNRHLLSHKIGYPVSWLGYPVSQRRETPILLKKEVPSFPNRRQGFPNWSTQLPEWSTLFPKWSIRAPVSFFFFFATKRSTAFGNLGSENYVLHFGKREPIYWDKWWWLIFPNFDIGRKKIKKVTLWYLYYKTFEANR